jgi:hypothetical protein
VKRMELAVVDDNFAIDDDLDAAGRLRGERELAGFRSGDVSGAANAVSFLLNARRRRAGAPIEIDS